MPRLFISPRCNFPYLQFHSFESSDNLSKWVCVGRACHVTITQIVVAAKMLSLLCFVIQSSQRRHWSGQLVWRVVPAIFGLVTRSYACTWEFHQREIFSHWYTHWQLWSINGRSLGEGSRKRGEGSLTCRWSGRGCSQWVSWQNVLCSSCWY